MDHRKLIDVTMEFAREDRARSWYYLLSTLILVSTAIAGTIMLTGIFRVVCSVFMALFMVRLFVIYHDFRHGAILANSVAVSVFMNLFGLVALAPASIWSETHDHHHHNNSKFSTFVVGSFPIVNTNIFKSLDRRGRFKYLLLRHPLMILLGYVPIFLASFCLWPFFENPRRYWDCGLAAAAHFIIGGCLFYSGGWSMLVWTLLVPSLIMYAIGSYLFYAQHNFPGVKLSDAEEWDYFFAALHSSSYIRMNRVMRWITANIGFHHVHHVNSRIPFYRLPEAMAKIPELGNPVTTSLTVREIITCLRLKLWDDNKQRLITLAEFEKNRRV